MFRRREDNGLFDNTTDPNQSGTEAEESAVVVSSPSTSAAPATGSPSQSFSSASFSPSSIAPRSATPEVRPSSPQTASSFRSAPPSSTGDLSRSRLPESKPTSSMSNSMQTPPSASSFMPSAPDKSNKSGKRVLTVGNDILLKGEIATCDRLVIEGKVDATLNDVHTVEIAEHGSFKGSAHIEDAEISGLFEGDLVVRNRLVIYATGKVRGKITYGEIEIERGGELTGEIKTTTTQNATVSTRRVPVKEDNKVAA